MNSPKAKAKSKGEIFAFNTGLNWWQRFKQNHPNDSVEIAVGCVIDKNHDIIARFPDNAQAMSMMIRCGVQYTVR